MRAKAVLSFVAVFFLLWAPAATAQTVTGSILGVVTDSSGASVAGARVVALNVGTGEIKRGTTGTDGSYLFPVLPIGQYRVEAEMQGFNPS